MQCFADIDIAEACNQLLVEQCRLERRSLAGKACRQIVRRQGIARGFYAEITEKRVLVEPAACNQVHEAEPPRVVVDHPHLAVVGMVEVKKHMVVGRLLRPVVVENTGQAALSGNLDAATSMLDQAKARESGNAEIYKELGAVYLVRGDCSRANLAFEQYFVLDPNALDREQIEMKLLACGR